MGLAECGHFRGVVNLKGQSLLLCVSIYLSIYFGPLSIYFGPLTTKQRCPTVALAHQHATGPSKRATSQQF